MHNHIDKVNSLEVRTCVRYGLNFENEKNQKF